LVEVDVEEDPGGAVTSDSAVPVVVGTSPVETMSSAPQAMSNEIKRRHGGLRGFAMRAPSLAEVPGEVFLPSPGSS
jgi:hypothetical protein